MDHAWVNAMMVIKEIFAIMNRGGRSQDEEERMRRIMREVMSETSNTSAAERDMIHRMMQLLEQNVTKHTAELHATTQERDHYKAKMEELTGHMERLMRDRGAHPSGGESPALAARQKKLAETCEELKNMRQRERSDRRTQGKPFSRGGERGGSGASGARKPWYQSQSEGVSSQFSRQSKDSTQFSPGKHPFQGGDSEKVDGHHEGYKSGSFQSKPFQQDNNYQGGQTPFSKRFPQHDGRGGRHDFGPCFNNTPDKRGFPFDNRHRQGNCGPGFNNRDAVQNVGVQNRGPTRGSFQPRGQSCDRAQHHQTRGQRNPHHRQFYQHRGRSQEGGQDQRSGSRNRPSDFSSSQFTPEEIEALKSVLKKREAGAECTGKQGSVPLLVNPSQTAVKKKKKKKKQKKPEDSKKKKRGKNKSSKDQAAAEQKPEGLSPLEVFTASGFDVSQIAGLKMDDTVSDMMLIAKEGGNIVSCQPETMRELVEFKQKYPNAQAIIVKTSEQQ